MNEALPQHQLYLDANGDPCGDCWRTALAILLGIERDTVPHFLHLYQEPAPEDPNLSARWFTESQAWVEANVPGYVLRSYEVKFPFWLDGRVPDRAYPHVVLTGKSPRGVWNHCVVVDAVTGDLAHDPHPAGGGVLDPFCDVLAVIPEEYAT